MSTEQKEVAPPPSGDAKSLMYAERGIKTSADFASMMSLLMSDLISGRVSAQVGNAVCNAGGKLLKIVEMQHRYGTPEGQQPKEKIITLASGV